MGVLVMDVVAEDVVPAGVSRDVTGREECDVKEGDKVEAVDVGMSAWEDDPEGGVVAAMEPVDSEEEEAEEEDIDNRNTVIHQYFQ
ncbi:hypothetical protein NDU88_010347 [Pleurodeles waltl]|uniref:Uncharacterized protein n=1 Tax=Pleurodeles waltl TaxID=8319 RepID=A0AAV7S120_PLEWA|nr:hypothetical protein NDU88_010347 [Pleurodeles waltl]